MFSFEICEIYKNTYFEKQLQTIASAGSTNWPVWIVIGVYKRRTNDITDQSLFLFFRRKSKSL